MINSRFSNLVYRIIGKPEINHDEYSDIMHNALDEISSFHDPNHFSELAIGDQILSRIETSNEAFRAFSTLLDNSRFKIIILDEDFSPIYNNKNSQNLYNSIISTKDDNCLKASLLKAIHSAVGYTRQESQEEKPEGLISVDYSVNSEQQIYLRSVQNQLGDGLSSQPGFYFLMSLDHNRQSALNPQLVERFELTQREQSVLVNLIHAKSIKQIAEKECLSENTIKTHLKSLYRKTDTNSQTQIVRLVLTHEAQVLDSYFDTSSGVSDVQDNASKDQYLTLKNGHQIVYRDYGPKDAYPVIVFHNSYGSRLMVPHNYQEICKRANRRVIIPDRPGFGQTLYYENHPEQWNEFLNEFIDTLEIGKYDVLAAVLGCPLAIHFAAQADERLQRMILASPILVNTKDDTQYLKGILSPAQLLVAGSTTFAKQVYELWLKSIKLNLGTHYRNMLELGFGSAEQEKFKREGTADLMVKTFRETSSKTLDGLSNEMIYFLSPRNIELSKITIPVDLWWGTEDERFAREGVEKLATQFPNSTLHVKEGYSEHLYYALFEEMIR